MRVLPHDLLQLARTDDITIQDQLVAALYDLRNAHAGRRHADEGYIHQPLHALGRAAVTVDEFVQHILCVGGRLDGRNALVGLDAPGGVRNVVLRQEGVHRDIHKTVALVRGRGLAAGRGNGLAQHLHVQIVAHGLHMAVLAVAQKAARTAYLQIAHGDTETRAEGGELPDGRKPLGGNFCQHFIACKREIRIRLAGGTPHAAAYLVQLRQAHPVCILDDQRVAVAHIDAGLDQRRADKNVDLIVQ